MKSIFGVASLACTFGFLAACGDDSSTSPETPSVPLSSESLDSSSSEIAEPLSSSETGEVPAVSSSATATSSSEQVLNPASSASTNFFLEAPVADADGFYAIGDVYNAVDAANKIVFVIRHSERESSEGQESQLTAAGVAQAQAVGATLVSNESFYYASTDFVRTRETCNNIALGRGETAEVVTWDGINGDYFYKVSSDSLDALVGRRGGSWKIISQWAYGIDFSNSYVAKVADDYFYDIFERGAQFINEVVLANVANWKRVSFLATHDILIEPLVVYATNRTVDVNFSVSGRWVNYLTGVAVIINGAGETLLLPVRGYDVGWMVYQKATE